MIVNVNAYTVEHGELHGEQSMVNFLPYRIIGMSVAALRCGTSTRNAFPLPHSMLPNTQ